MAESRARSGSWTVVVTLVSTVLLAVLSTPARAHIEYVDEGGTVPTDPVVFARDVLTEPANTVLFGGTALLGLLTLVGYLVVRPRIRDIEVLRTTLDGYRDLIPWMLRLSFGLPLVGAGFAGYYFSPAVQTSPRLLMVGLGFFLLCGLATRAVAAVGLLAYLAGLATDPRLILAIEYLPGLLAIVIVGGGRPSADHMLAAVASADGTLYGRIDPVHRLAAWFDGLVTPFEEYAATVIRVGLGIGFVYLGLFEKLLQPARAVGVVTKYDLTAIIPVDPGAWVLGAALAEIALGLLLIAGLLTRSVAATAFVVFTMTLFGLPDDPVLAHITMFGLASAVFTLGSGPLALDNVVARVDRRHETPTPAD